MNMNLTIPIETSARHIHITEEDFHTLFGPGAKPTFSKELSQPLFALVIFLFNIDVPNSRLVLSITKNALHRADG